MKTFDIFIGTQGYVSVMNEGFFEKVNGRDFDESKQTTFIIGDDAYRVHTEEYRSKKEIFDNFFKQCGNVKKLRKNIVIDDTTDRDELMKAIDIFEKHCRCTILKLYIHCDHTFTMVEYDGKDVTSWTGNIYDFFKRRVEYFEITGIM